MEHLKVAETDKNATISKEETIDSCAKRCTLADVQLILAAKNKRQDIVLSDRCTKLLDLLLIMNNCTEFNDFLQKLKDVNVIIPFNSPIWAGYNLLHLSVILNKKTCQDIIKFDLLDTTTAVCEQYNWTEEEETLYWKRIELCLEYGCSVSMKNTKGQTPIHLAFNMLRETTVIEKLLSCCKVNITDENGLSHLHISCALGQVDAAKKYVTSGANVNSQVRTSFNWYQKDSHGMKTINLRVNSTPLHVAVAFGHQELVEYLLENNADVYAKDSLDLTPLHLVMSRNGTYDLQKLARIFFKKIPNLHDSVSKAGLSHLHVAASTKDEKALKRMLRKGAQVDCVVEANVTEPPFLADLAGKTPLFLAVYKWDKVIEILLEYGANVHAKDLKGISVLQYSVSHLEDAWTTPIVDMLKSGKCDVGASGVTMLHFACGDLDFNWTKKLLKNGADVNARITANQLRLQGATPLYILLRSSFIYEIGEPVVDFVKLLLNSGADVTIECCNGFTPLNLLYEQLHEDVYLDEDFGMELFLLQIADLLLEAQKSYDINPVCIHGFTHFHFACERNKVEIVKKFLDNGVDVNISTYPDMRIFPGFTPLHFALIYGSKEVAYLLLEKGADVNAQDAHGNTSLHIAIKRNFVDLPLIETMLSRGADINAKNFIEESLLHCLLKSKSLTLERLNFFLDRGCSLNITQKIMGLAMLSVAPIYFRPFLERLVQVIEMKSAIQNGFDVIQSIVTVNHDGKLTVDNYLSAIEFLIGIGCELDRQNLEGRTALHEAVSCYNLEAVDALLQLGADVNMIDYKNKCPFSDDIIMDAEVSNEFRKTQLVQILAKLRKRKSISF